MGIPDYQSLMLPLLQFLADGKEHNLPEATLVLSDQFELTPEERLQLLPSGQANHHKESHRLGSNLYGKGWAD